MKTLRRFRRILILLCVAVLLWGTLYIIRWNVERSRILAEEKANAALYYDNLTQTPTQATPAWTSSPSPTPAPTATVTASDAIIQHLPTEPPVSDRFGDLLLRNPDTIGFLRVEEYGWPVVWRQYDNAYYLNHAFDGQEAKEGAIFLDGSNLLVPEDDCLVIYGHNMKNNTMFGRMGAYTELTHFRDLGTVHLDTLYGAYDYVPFALFEASVDPDDKHYFPLRTFVFNDAAQADAYVEEMRSRSRFRVSIACDAQDDYLLLVTCAYNGEDDRLILALRRLRDEETPEAMASAVANAK